MSASAKMAEAMTPGRVRRGLAAALLAGASMPAAAALPDAFDLGRGPQGELCRAERVWRDPAARDVFDQVYQVRCRGWTETATVGRVAMLGGGQAAQAALEKARVARLACGEAARAPFAGLGTGLVARCRSREGAFDAWSASVERDGRLIAADGLQRFAPNLLAAARALAGAAPPPGATDAPAGALDLATAGPPPALAEGAADFDAGALAGRRGEVLDYSIRGQHGEARELATRYLARLPAAASVVERVEFTLEAALSASNLGYGETAQVNLDQAAALLAGLGPSRAGTAEELRAKLNVYRAIDALNRRDFTAAVALSDAAFAAGADRDTAGGAPLQDLAVLRGLNAVGGGGLGARDQSWVRPTTLRAQALYVRGAALRGLNRTGEAAAVLEGADRLLQRFDERGLDPSNLLWLRSGVAAERGRVAQRRGDAADARAQFDRAAAMLERSSIYVGTPLLAARRAEQGNARLAAGDAAGARDAYDRAFETLRGVGPSGAAGIGGMDGYFGLLSARIAAGGPDAAAATERFFELSQLISPPAVATQIAQLQKIFEGGTSDAAVRAKTLQDLDRESRALATRLSMLPADARDRGALQAELTTLEARASQVRAELAGDQQFQQATESVATLAELQAALRPDEAYLKLVTLAGPTYAMLVRRDRAVVYRAALDTPALAALSGDVRRSIDGATTADGRVIVLVFDVERAHALHEALLGGGAALLDGAATLVTEPTGAMTQLPFGVLVTDRASVDAFAQSVKENSRDYTGVKFLANARRIDTAVSPRSFLISRSVAASRATLPYLGMGNHAAPTAAQLAALPRRGAFRGQCGAQEEALRQGFASLRPVGAAEIDAARRAMGAGSAELEQRAFTDTAVTDPDAKGGRLRDFAVLHFATHGLKEGELDCDSPPALVTSIGDGDDSDGLLSFEEIAGLSLDANLAVLSACNTAASASAARAGGSGFRNELGQAATLNGLARAFLVAGSRAVLTTHWAIPDSFRARDGRQVEASTRLIARMFQQGASGPMGGALRDAQLMMHGEVDTSHPYYWGAFMLVGDGARPMLTRAAEVAAR